MALVKFNQLHGASVQNTTRSKSKSPRRSRPNPEEPLPLPPVDSTNPYGKPRSRRPHTSAGPRDKSMNFAGRPRDQGGELPGEIGSSSDGISKRRSELVLPSTTPWPESRDSLAKQPRNDGWKPNFWPSNRANCSNAPIVLKNTSNSMTPSSSSNSSPRSGGEEETGLREWEEELMKIEKKSRKSSDLLGFFKRKRSQGAL